MSPAIKLNRENKLVCKQNKRYGYVIKWQCHCFNPQHSLTSSVPEMLLSLDVGNCHRFQIFSVILIPVHTWPHAGNVPEHSWDMCQNNTTCNAMQQEASCCIALHVVLFYLGLTIADLITRDNNVHVLSVHRSCPQRWCHSWMPNSALTSRRRLYRTPHR